jgi:heptosyltransferase-1
MKRSEKPAIVVVRLGSMGDMIHTLPAVASLKQGFPGHRILWVVAPRWAPLLEGNPYVDEIVTFNRHRISDVFDSWKRLVEIRPDKTVDFQGLLQSALVSRITRPRELIGWSRQDARESLAALFYSIRVVSKAAHIVDKNIELAMMAGAPRPVYEFPVPQGEPEGVLPAGLFVLAHPFAGWKSKQWPLENYGALARLLSRESVRLVANVAPARAAELAKTPDVMVHVSSLPGLIHATRRATAVLALDSGPAHLAAALRKPGVALFGPTDPSRNGPYGASIRVLRDPAAVNSYKRRDDYDQSMRSLSVQQVYEALISQLKLAESHA